MTWMTMTPPTTQHSSATHQPLQILPFSSHPRNPQPTTVGSLRPPKRLFASYRPFRNVALPLTPLAISSSAHLIPWPFPLPICGKGRGRSPSFYKRFRLSTFSPLPVPRLRPRDVAREDDHLRTLPLRGANLKAEILEN